MLLLPLLFIRVNKKDFFGGVFRPILHDIILHFYGYFPAIPKTTILSNLPQKGRTFGMIAIETTIQKLSYEGWFFFHTTRGDLTIQSQESFSSYKYNV